MKIFWTSISNIYEDSSLNRIVKFTHQTTSPIVVTYYLSTIALDNHTDIDTHIHTYLCIWMVSSYAKPLDTCGLRNADV